MIFVTGATGLLGSHLIKVLLKQQQPVKALYRTVIPVFENSDKVEWVQGDILDVPFLENGFQNVKQVYHCAALVSFNPKHLRELYKTNVEGTANVVNACLNTSVEKLLYVSSVAALGRKKITKEIDETQQWSSSAQNSEYGKTKHLAEMEVWRGVGEGLNSVIVNPSIILGAGDWNEGSSQIFKSVYNEFPWYTDGVTGFVDVTDVVRAMILLMQSDITTERFILNGVNMLYKDLFSLIADGFHKKHPHRKINPFLAALIWRAEALRSMLSGSHPLLTKETTRTAQSQVYFNNEKLLKILPQFHYTTIESTVSRICNEYKTKYSLV